MNKRGQENFMVGVFVVGIFLIAFLIIFSCLGIHQVDASHKGVIVRFGTVLGVMEPGLAWNGFFTDVNTYDLRIRKTSVEMTGSNNAPDKTGQPVYARIDVNYRLKPASVESIYKNVGTDDMIVDKLNIIPIITEGFKRATVKYEALELLDKREELAHLAEQNIRDRFPTEYFEIDQVVVSNIDYSEQFKKALDDKKTMTQLAEVSKQNLEKVKFDQQSEIEKYKAEAEKLRLQKTEINDLMVRQMWINKWDGKLPAYLISSQSGSNQLLQLPSGQ